MSGSMQEGKETMLSDEKVGGLNGWLELLKVRQLLERRMKKRRERLEREGNDKDNMRRASGLSEPALFKCVAEPRQRDRKGRLRHARWLAFMPS
jgi:hypothetical protein